MAYVYQDIARSDILRMVPPDGHVIGSIGCGYAATELELVKQGRHVHGVDISPEAIERAATRLTSAKVISSNDREPFAVNSLDGLILADVLEHIPRAWSALQHFTRAVKPGGWVALSVPNMRNLHVLRTFWLGGEWPEQPIGIFDETHVQVMSKRRLVRWCGAAGLRVEKWFDRYGPAGPRRELLYKTLDAASLRLFNSWFLFQLQCLCRREKSG